MAPCFENFTIDAAAGGVITTAKATNLSFPPMYLKPPATSRYRLGCIIRERIKDVSDMILPR